MFLTFVTVLGLVIVDSAYGSPQGSTRCKGPLAIPNGNFFRHQKDSTATYHCNEGYYLIGDETLTCKGRRWSGNPPICAASGCQRLNLLEHGTIIYNHEMKIATFQCDRNFKLDGPTMIVCELSGWSENMPTCKGRSPKPISKHEQNLMESDYSCITKDKQVIPPRDPYTMKSTQWAMIGGKPRLYTVYRCNWGYVPVGSRQRNMYCKQGKWIGVRQQCKYIGRFAHDDEHARQELKKDKSHEDWLKSSDYSCMTAPGPSTIHPPSINNAITQIKVAIIMGMPHMYVHYVCDDGYTLRGENQFMYCIDKRWWGHIPMCVKK